MKTLNRLLLLILSGALLVAVYLMHANTTQISLGHDTFYSFKWPWLHEVREVSIFAILGWCLLFLRGDPAFARVGLAAVIVAFAIMNWPLNHGLHLPDLPTWH